jgi:hypothetical protein
MKPMTLPLLAALLISPLSRADEACSRAAIHYLFKNPEHRARTRVPSPFDLETLAAEAFRESGLNGQETLLSCQAGQEICLKSEAGQWSLLSEDGPQELSLKKNTDEIVMSHLTHHYSGGDPWYGIGASHWTRELRLTLKPSSLALKSLFIDGANTTLGFSKRTRAEGRCTRTSAEPIRNKIRDRLKSELFKAMRGDPSAIGDPIETNFLRTPSGSLIQITGLEPASGEVTLLDLESETLRRVPIGSLASLQPVNVMAILRDMKRARAETGPNPDGLSTRQLHCIQGANALVDPSSGSRDMHYRGYTRIEISRTHTGPGADLGYRPLSKFRITRAGWEGNYRPATLPFGKMEAIAVMDESGSAGFIASGPNGIRISPIWKMDARTTQERHGLPAGLIAFEDTLCFAH